jgi:hypothetical protein
VPFNFAPTEVMTLGKLGMGSVRPMNVGDFYTQPPNQFLNPPRTTPGFPQNLARQTLNGLGRFRRIALGDLPAASPAALTNQSADPTVSSNVPGTTPGVVTHVVVDRMDWSPATLVVAGTIATASSLVSLYHGYKRNNSLGWGLLWGLFGATFPLITPTVALAQGYAVRRGRR